MKLAEGLQERADLNRRIEQLRERICNNAVMQEGVKPVEQPEALLEDLEGSLNRMEALICAINRTNMETIVDGVPLTSLIAKRDVMKLRIGILRDTVNCASNLCKRSRGDEIRQFAAIDVRELQNTTDGLSREYRILDNRIQSVNWTTEMV